MPKVCSQLEEEKGGCLSARIQTPMGATGKEEMTLWEEGTGPQRMTSGLLLVGSSRCFVPDPINSGFGHGPVCTTTCQGDWKDAVICTWNIGGRRDPLIKKEKNL